MAIKKNQVQNAYDQLYQNFGKEIEECYNFFKEYSPALSFYMDEYYNLVEAYVKQESKKWDIEFSSLYDLNDIPLPGLCCLACEVYEIRHSYSDWQGNDSDYGEITNQALLDYVDCVCGCDECNGCGDW